MMKLLLDNIIINIAGEMNSSGSELLDLNETLPEEFF